MEFEGLKFIDSKILYNPTLFGATYIIIMCTLMLCSFITIIADFIFYIGVIDGNNDEIEKELKQNFHHDLIKFGILFTIGINMLFLSRIDKINDKMYAKINDEYTYEITDMNKINLGEINKYYEIISYENNILTVRDK